MNTSETWAPIPGYEGWYEASDTGRVRSLSREVTYSDGRVAVRSGKLIAASPDGMVACHNNGNVSDNRVQNLRWDTMAANMADKKRHGTCYQLNKSHCANGHEFTPENTNIHKTSRARLCKICQQAQSQRAYAKKLARRSGVAA